MDIVTIDHEGLIQQSYTMDIGNDPYIEIDEYEEFDVESHVRSDDEDNSESITPVKGMMFNTHDEAYKFYNQYALRMGFGTRKESSYYSKTEKSKLVGRKFTCRKEGKKKESAKSVLRTRDIRTGCKAMMIVRLIENGSWRVSTVVLEHNHELSTPSKSSKHRSHKKLHLAPVVKNLIDELHSDGLTNANIVKVVNGSEPDQDHMITSQQVHDHLRVERKNNLGKSCGMVVKHFMDRKVKEPDFFFSIEVTDDFTLRSVFWADQRSRESYKMFSDVIIFDVTYRTNTFSLPFAPFTGINHHRQSTLFGCALLSDETEDTFVWLFQQWLHCMGGEEPKVIITDQDAAMGNAIARVFPNTVHRFCEWHLQKNIAENLVHLKAIHGPDIELDLEKLRTSDSIKEAEECWSELITKYNISETRWLPKLWERRKSWVHCYLKDTFVAGTRSSQRSESMNSFFDSYVTAHTPLHEFVLQYDKALASRRRAEDDADFNTMDSKHVPTLRWSLEEDASNRYTAKLFALIHKEMVDARNYFEEIWEKEGTVTTFKVGLENETDQNKLRTVIYDSNGVFVSCSCKYFETHGLLCRHTLWILRTKRISKIPDRYILKRWTMDAQYQSTHVVSRDDIISPEVDREKIWAMRYNFNRLAEASYRVPTVVDEVNSFLLRKLAEIDSGSRDHNDDTLGNISQCLPNHIPEINVRDPKEAVKTKGRPKLPSRLKGFLENSQEQEVTKKRTCGHCGEKGHYKTGCRILKEAQKKQGEGQYVPAHN